MKREQMLNEVKQVQDILEMDELFLNRSIRNLQDSLEDKKRELRTRLKSETPVDQATVEVTYKSIGDLEQKIKLYESFKNEFYS